MPVLRRPWSLAAFATLVAIAVWAVATPASLPVKAPSLFLLFAIFLAFWVTERTQLHLEFGRHALSISAPELALVVGLVEIGGVWTAVARLAAVLLVLVPQAIGAPKTVFNLALGAIEVALAALVLSVLPPIDLVEPSAWGSLMLALLTGTVAGVVFIGFAITVTGGPPGTKWWITALVSQLITGSLSLVVGLVALMLAQATPWAWLLIVPLVLAAVAVFRQSQRSGQARRNVQQVYDFARRVENVSPDEAGTREIVTAVRELMNADRVALWMPPYLDEPPRLVVDSEGEGAAWYDGPGDPDDMLRRRAIEAGAEPVRLTRGRSVSVEERAALDRRAAREVIGASISTAAGEPGYLEVCDRSGAVSVSFGDGDRGALASMLTHVNAAIRQQQLLSQIRYDADHDRLTGLPNRQRLALEIDAVLNAETPNTRVGLVLAALDNYTDVTDTLGHAASDELLLVTAGLLREHAPPHAVLARMEGERFAILLPGLSLAATERAARRLREAAATRSRVAGLDLEVTLTIGVAAAPVHGADSGTLMQRADVALLAARTSSGGVATYHPVLDQQSLRRLQLGTEIEAAMTNGEISVVFQPIIDARTSDIVSVETLVRWAHPRYGQIPPDDFISLAEQIGRIGPLTDFVLDLALARCRRWLDDDIALSVAVNLSARCLAEPDLVSRVREALRRHGVPGELLILELTEGIVVDDTVRNSSVLADLHALGLRLSMDDFGTGYSSLSQLRQLPIDELKIDKSFVLGMSTSQSEAFIARSIVELAHNLGLRVVAEGVEDELTRDQLAAMGCDKLQGFLVSRPLPEDKLESWLLARAGIRSAAPGATHRRLWVRN